MPVKRFSRTKLFTHNEQELELFKIANSFGIEIDILNYGARITSLKIPTRFSSDSYEDVVLGFDSYDKYFSDVDYINAIVGRVANRIAYSGLLSAIKNSQYPQMKVKIIYMAAFKVLIQKFGILLNSLKNQNS